MKKLLLTVLSLATVACMAFGAAACEGGDPGSSSSSSSSSSASTGSSDSGSSDSGSSDSGSSDSGSSDSGSSDSGSSDSGSSDSGSSDSGSSDSGSSDSGSSDSSGGGSAANEAPVIQIAVGTETIEWHAGEMSQQEAVETLGMEITVIDEDSGLEATIIDLDGFDINVEGTYTITYYVEDSGGLSATATRTVNVLEALPGIVLEVQAHKNTNGPAITQLMFPNQNFLTVTEDASFDMQSCVVYNSSSESVVVTVGGGYGCAAIVNANGIAIEGRDGTNGKLMNAANPSRGASTVACTPASFAADMEIPAGGFAIVIQQNTFGTTANDDGRNFMNYNVINTYGTPVRLFMQDAPTEYLTTYVDQGPIITANGAVTVLTTDSLDDAKAKALVGFNYSDDNGTFEIADDVKTGLTATVLDVGEYVAGTEGTYTFTVEITDGTNATEFTRTINVVSANWTLSYNGPHSGNPRTITVTESQLLVVDGTTACPSTNSYAFVVFTPEYEGTLNFTGGWSAAVVVDKYGKIKTIYDGANVGVYSGATFGDKTNTIGLTTSNCMEKAFEAWNPEEGEYLIIARNDGGTNAARGYILNMRYEDANGGGADATDPSAVGQKLTISGVNTDKTITFEQEPATQE